jgi:HEAT repeats
MTVLSSLDVLRAPLTPLDLVGTHEFQQTQIRGVSLAIDAEARARIAAAIEVAKSGDAANAVPSLVDMMGQDRVGGNVGPLLAALESGKATSDDGRQAENMAYFAEADLACQVTASDALASIGVPAVAALTGALKSPSANVRSGAAKALGQIGAAAEAALPVLKGLMRTDPEETVRTAAEEAVKRVKPRRWF